MKKLNKKGFLLVETLIVSTFIATTMIFIFVQFRRINSDYKRLFSYNTVDGVYATKEINQFLLNNGFDKIINYMTERTEAGEVAHPEPYVEIYHNHCVGTYVDELNYCDRLMETLNVKRVLVTYSNLDEKDFHQNIDSYDEFDDGLKRFIKSIKYDTGDEEINRRRTIVEFNNQTYATLKLYQRGNG